MKNIILFFTLLIGLPSCIHAQNKKGEQHVVVCEKGNGCEIVEQKTNSAVLDKALGKSGFWINASDSATLVIENCTSRIEESLSLVEIHQFFGGKGEPQKIRDFDLSKYLKGKGCSSDCANTIKKITFYISTSGEEAHSGNGYFFLNLKAGEAFMPNEAFQQFYGSEAKGIIYDQFIRNGTMESYTIAEGEKYHTKMPIGTTVSLVKNDAFNEQRFKTDFKKTGRTRKHLNTTEIETEYKGKDDEGKMISFWITPAAHVCLPKGKFDAFGFYNLGYISIDRATYLVTELSGSGFQIRLTGISEGSYNFKPVGYKSIGF